jgi:hypothetical protein
LVKAGPIAAERVFLFFNPGGRSRNLRR